MASWSLWIRRAIHSNVRSPSVRFQIGVHFEVNHLQPSRRFRFVFCFVFSFGSLAVASDRPQIRTPDSATTVRLNEFDECGYSWIPPKFKLAFILCESDEPEKAAHGRSREALNGLIVRLIRINEQIRFQKIRIQNQTERKKLTNGKKLVDFFYRFSDKQLWFGCGFEPNQWRRWFWLLSENQLFGDLFSKSKPIFESKSNRWLSLDASYLSFQDRSQCLIVVSFSSV